MRDATQITRVHQLERALAMVTVEGELDFCWRWRVDVVQAPGGDGWLIAPEFTRPDRDTGIAGRGLGRPFFVRSGATAHDVWRTAFAAIKRALDHELLEGFKVNGRRVFDPHGPILGGSLPALEESR